ncbi:MAG: Wzz/FepE/Etk N-terminal domain-containing protein [Flavobacteriaceae bacterium]|nr:Wzz/FepE/Etk N-terminal domain-containing protein [Flavobacteriaceae bacterium]MDG2274577.1 Wzz/FepE/Etk N-terminal domain-containing protein [Flavobacteriaceae bacterium]
MTTPTTHNNSSENQEDSIDIIALLQSIWTGKKLILKTVLVFMILGLFIAVFSQNEYTASITIVPQSSSEKPGGSLGGIAALAGINLGSVGQQSSISPTLYPQILTNISFQKELLETLITIEGQDNKITYKEYYTNVYNPSVLSSIKKYTIGLPGVLIGLLKSDKTSNEKSNNNDSLPQITEDDKKLVELLLEQLSMEVNDKDGYISLSTTMPEARAAAELTQKAQELLEQYVIDFKIEKSSSELDFIKNRYQEKEQEFQKIQQKLAVYTDRNQNVNSARAKMELMLLQSEYDLAYGVYSELAKQLETQELKVKEDTPIFTILQPVFVPLEKTGPKRSLIFIIYTFLGFVLSIGYILALEPIQNIIKEIRSTKEN